MLTISHHPHDAKWIKAQINKLPPGARVRALQGYDQVHRATLDAHSGHIDADGFARREANKRLREFIEKVLTPKPA